MRQGSLGEDGGLGFNSLVNTTNLAIKPNLSFRFAKCGLRSDNQAKCDPQIWLD